MKSVNLVGLGLVGAAFATFGVAACGGSSNSGTGGAATTSSSSSSSSTTTSSSSSSTTTTSSSGGTGTGGSGGGGGAGGSGGGNTIATAIPVNVDSETMGTLASATDQAYYSFTGTAGERLLIAVDATDLASTMPFDPTMISPAFGLYDSMMTPLTPITYQSGEFPQFSQNAQLFVQLPVTGTYYVGLSDCNGFFMSGCPNPASGITDLSYTIVVADTSKLTPAEVVANAAQDAPSLTASYVTPQGGKAGEYSAVFFGGDFAGESAGTGSSSSSTGGTGSGGGSGTGGGGAGVPPSANAYTQVFTFTPPTNSAPAAPGRARGEFYVQVIGAQQGGDLSAASVLISVLDGAGNIYAQADQANYVPTMTTYSPLDLSFVYTPGNTYYVVVQNDDTTGKTAQDFYFITHYLNALIDVGETAAAHGSAATAQALTAQGSAGTLYAIDGSITAPGTEQDWYSMPVPASVKQIAMECDAQRSGSGLRGFEIQIFQSDMKTSVLSATESATMDINSPSWTNLPASATASSLLYMDLTAMSQAPGIVGNQYRCFVFFQ